MATMTKPERAVHVARVAARNSTNYAATLAREVERSAAQLAAMTASHEAVKARAARAQVAADRDAAILANLVTVKEP